MRTTACALARGAWLEQFNQGWRFSRVKAGLWLTALQVGVAALLLWRMQPQPAPVPLLAPVTTAATLSILGAFLLGLLRGREDLYGKSVLRALHVSPAPGAGILLGLTLGGLPGRLLRSVVMAVLVGWLLPAGALWWLVPLLWVLALLGGMAGYAAAVLALVGWVGVTPRSLAVLWAVAVAGGFNLITLLIGLMTLGGPAAPVAAFIREAAPWGFGGVGGLTALPAAWIAMRGGRRGEGSGDRYREAYLTMQELADGRRRLRASRWPRVLPGPAGALQARQWRELWLNWLTWTRVVLMLLVLSLPFWGDNKLAWLIDRFPVAVPLAFGLTAALGAFGELPAVIGGSDGPNIGLSMVAGVRAGQVIIAKWVACLPFAVLSAACTWGISVLLARPHLPLSLAAGCIGLGFSVIAMACGLHDLDPHAEVVERDVPPILRAALEQVPRQLGGVLGWCGGVAFAAAAGWLCQRWPEGLLPVAAGSAALAHLALVPGCLRLKRLGM